MKKSNSTSKNSPKAPKRKRARRKDTNTYVNQKEFMAAMRAYYDSDEISEELAIYIKKIAEGLSYAPNFINYTYKEEMVGDAILKMVQALEHKKFDLENRDNPFGYFTTIAFHAFINRIKKEKKQREMINDYQEQVYNELMCENNQTNVGQVYVADNTNDE